MLTAIFKVFETTEIQLTSKAINRLRLSSVLGMFALPFFGAVELLALPKAVDNGLIFAGVLSSIALLYVSFARLGNRLWIPEKYLDEVEIDRKRRSASLTTQIMMVVFILLAGVAAFLERAGLGAGLGWTPRAFTFLFVGLLFVTICTQTAIAAWMTEPLAENNVEKAPSDVRYPWIAIGIIIVLVVINVLAKYLF